MSKFDLSFESGEAPKPPRKERKRLPLAPGQRPCVKLGSNKKYKESILRASQRTGMPPESIAATIDAEAAKKNGEWNPASYNRASRAQGLTQFIPGTWQTMATTKGTYLNEQARALGYVEEHTTKKGATYYKIVPGKEQDLLDLRTDPDSSIVTAAEYDTGNMKALSAEGLIPSGLSGDEQAYYSYLTHHEGLGGARQILNGTLSDERARKLLPKQVGKKKADELIAAENGDAAKAYVKWLDQYTKKNVKPSKFRCTDETIDGDEAPEAKAAEEARKDAPPPKKSTKKKRH